jgi:hypothetical protein
MMMMTTTNDDDDELMMMMTSVLKLASLAEIAQSTVSGARVAGDAASQQVLAVGSALRRVRLTGPVRLGCDPRAAGASECEPDAGVLEWTCSRGSGRVRLGSDVCCEGYNRAHDVGMQAAGCVNGTCVEGKGRMGDKVHVAQSCFWRIHRRCSGAVGGGRHRRRAGGMSRLCDVRPYSSAATSKPKSDQTGHTHSHTPSAAVK